MPLTSSRVSAAPTAAAMPADCIPASSFVRIRARTNWCPESPSKRIVTAVSGTPRPGASNNICPPARQCVPKSPLRTRCQRVAPSA